LRVKTFSLESFFSQNWGGVEGLFIEKSTIPLRVKIEYDLLSASN